MLISKVVVPPIEQNCIGDWSGFTDWSPDSKASPLEKGFIIFTSVYDVQVHKNYL